MDWILSTVTALVTSPPEKSKPVRIQPSALNGPQRRMLADEMNITAMDIMHLFTEEELFDIAVENNIDYDSIDQDHEDLARAVTSAVILRRVDWEAELPQEIEIDPAVPVISDWDLDDEMQQLEQECDDAWEEVQVQPECDDRIDLEDESRHADLFEEHVEEVNVNFHVKTLKRQAEEEIDIDSLNSKLRRTGEPSGAQDVPLAALEPDDESVNGEDASD